MSTHAQNVAFRGERFFLSNFSACQIVYEGITYPTTEHAFQAAKTLNNDERKRMASIPTPGMVKKAGRTIKGFRKDWDSIRLTVMEEVLRIKFKIPEYRDKLLATGDEKLCEENDWGDTYWGMCQGRGQNHLGQILMRIRTEIKAEHDQLKEMGAQ